MAIFIMLSNYTHDLATGLLFGSVIAYLVANRVIERVSKIDDRNHLREKLFERLRPAVLWSLAAVLLLGIPRMIYYYDYEWLPAAGRGQILALAIKHVFLVSITIGSLVMFFRQRPKVDPGQGEGN